MGDFMMVTAVRLPGGPGGYGPEKVEALKGSIDRLTELDLGSVANAVDDLRDLVADEVTASVAGRPGWFEETYTLVAGGAEEMRDYLVRAVDEVLGVHPHPHVAEVEFGGIWYVISGGISGGDAPSEAYGWVTALDASGILEEKDDT